VIGCRRWERVGSRFCRTGERFDVDDLGAKVFERGPCLEVAVRGFVRYPDLGAAMVFRRGSLARRWWYTGGPLWQSSLRQRRRYLFRWNSSLWIWGAARQWWFVNNGDPLNNHGRCFKLLCAPFLT